MEKYTYEFLKTDGVGVCGSADGPQDTLKSVILLAVGQNRNEPIGGPFQRLYALVAVDRDALRGKLLRDAITQQLVKVNQRTRFFDKELCTTTETLEHSANLHPCKWRRKMHNTSQESDYQNSKKNIW